MKTLLSDAKYLMGYALPIFTIVSIYVGGFASFWVPVYAFLIIPLLELGLPKLTKNLTEVQEMKKLQQHFFDFLLYFNVPLQLFIVGYLCYSLTWRPLMWWEQLGMIWSTGICCGVIGINVAHELGHRTNRWEQQMGELLLLTSLYMHFFIEHNRGHHKNVSTPLDPASAAKNQTLYAFFIQSISGSLKHAWTLEFQRLQKLNISMFSWQNYMLRYAVFQVSFVLLLAFVFSAKAAAGFVGAAFIGILLLETVNYIEHYGLQRREIEPGIYEKVKPTHSWNSDHVLGRIMLYELTRHSDHHYKATRKYQILRRFDESPQLPFGYPGSMVLSFIPPLWFKIMNPLVERYSPPTKALQANAA